MLLQVALLLRRGPRDALSILSWALLPALVWWFIGEPRTLMVLLGTLGLAMLLRAGQPWYRVLLVSVVLGVVYGVILGTVFREPIGAGWVVTSTGRSFVGRRPLSDEPCSAPR